RDTAYSETIRECRLQSNRFGQHLICMMKLLSLEIDHAQAVQCIQVARIGAHRLLVEMRGFGQPAGLESRLGLLRQIIRHDRNLSQSRTLRHNKKGRERLTRGLFGQPKEITRSW